MARKISTTINTDAPSSDYPVGRIRNKSGAVAGTPIVEEIYGDITQFFAAMMESAKLINPGFDYNNLPDNVSNGWQLYTALMTVLSKVEEEWHYVGQNGEQAFGRGFANANASTYTNVRFKKDFYGYLIIEGWLLCNDYPYSTIFELPASHIPSKNIELGVVFWSNSLPGTKTTRLGISTAGVVSIAMNANDTFGFNLRLKLD